MAAKIDIGPRPDFTRKQEVWVREPHYRARVGIVLTVKPSSVSGWWVDVQNATTKEVISVRAEYVAPLETPSS